MSDELYGACAAWLNAHDDNAEVIAALELAAGRMEALDDTRSAYFIREAITTLYGIESLRRLLA